MRHPHTPEKDTWERAARFIGTPRFLVMQTGVVILWVLANVGLAQLTWDPYPFILLNLAFSTQAAYTGPVLQLVANRKAAVDDVRAALDHTHMEETHQLVADVHRWMRDNPDFPTPDSAPVD